jgi:tripartite-type tricarboxylate transporter receptor subunit TctC
VRNVLGTSTLWCIGWLAATLAGVGGAAAQAWPSRPVTIVSPFGAGSGVDILARHLANELSARLGQTFVVDNRVGANGNIGAAAAAKAPPDGATLLIVTPGIAVQNKYVYKTMPFDFDRDFSPIVLVAKAPMMVMVNPKLPVQTLGELLAYAKNNPGKVNVSSTGVGSQPHVTLELLNKLSGAGMTHVPYNSATLQNTDLVGGQIEAGINYVTTTLALALAGTVRPLAVTSTRRVRELPQVPTLEEAGFPGFESVGWYGLFAPRGTPAEVAEKVARVVNDYLATEKGIQHLRELGMQPSGGTATDLQAWIRSENERWDAILRTIATPK